MKVICGVGDPFVRWDSAGLKIGRLVSTVVLVALLAGCGSSHKAATSTTTTTLSTPATSTATTTTATTTTAAPATPEVVAGKAAYEHVMLKLGRQLSRSLQQMYPLVDDGAGSDANKEAATRVETARSAVAKITATLAGIIPPAAIRADHKQLVGGLEKLQVELGGLIQALQHGAAKPIGALTEFPALHTIATATTDIVNKGYAIE